MTKYIVTLSKEEREALSTLTSKGKHKSQKILNALILLGCDEGNLITIPCSSAAVGCAFATFDPYAATGNIRSFDLVLPERLEYLSFGVDPDPDNNGILNDTPPGLVTDNGDVIYYKLRGDDKRMVKLQDSVHIREGELVEGRWLPRSVDGLGQAVVLTSGSQSVTFELVYDRGTTYM